MIYIIHASSHICNHNLKNNFKNEIANNWQYVISIKLSKIALLSIKYVEGFFYKSSINHHTERTGIRQMKKQVLNVRRITAFGLALGIFALMFMWAPIKVNAAPNETQSEEQQAPAQPTDSLGLTAKSAVLMNAETGRIIYSVNENQQLPEASITKVMTMLLVFEAYDAGKIKMDDRVTCSEYAAFMGGSQIWLEPGETMTVHELIKAALVGSANDACVALGEHIAGSNDAFVSMMNQRAEELGMTNTFYCNCTGLDADGHVTSARDIAVASAELLRHEEVLQYTGIWMDSLRDGKLQLTNTNKLIKHYNGAIGLKTGTTSKAGCCISAAARRDGMTMIAVILGAPDSKSRFADAKKLLDYGFAKCELVDVSEIEIELPEIPVVGGIEKTIGTYADISGSVLTEKGKGKAIKAVVELPDSIEAPVETGQPIGVVNLVLDGEIIGSYDICSDRASDKVTFGAAFGELFRGLFAG